MRFRFLVPACAADLFTHRSSGGSMPFRLRSPALVLGAVALAGCTADPATAPSRPALAVEEAGHNASDHFKIDDPIAFTLESPCNGEMIEFTGRDLGEINAVDTREHLDAGFSLHFEHHSHVTATGTGQVTGITYDADEIFNERFESPSVPAPQFTGSFSEVIYVNSPVPGTSFTVRFAVSVVKPPFADLKVTRVIETAECGR
jgi:hypothetical protein